MCVCVCFPPSLSLSRSLSLSLALALSLSLARALSLLRRLSLLQYSVVCTVCFAASDFVSRRPGGVRGGAARVPAAAAGGARVSDPAAARLPELALRDDAHRVGRQGETSQKPAPWYVYYTKLPAELTCANFCADGDSTRPLRRTRARAYHRHQGTTWKRHGAAARGTHSQNVLSKSCPVVHYLSYNSKRHVRGACVASDFGEYNAPYQKAKREREAYLKTYQGLEPQIKELDAKMKETATWDHGRGDGRSADGQERATAGLEAKRLALDQAIAKAKSKWRASQDPVDRCSIPVYNLPSK